MQCSCFYKEKVTMDDSGDRWMSIPADAGPPSPPPGRTTSSRRTVQWGRQHRRAFEPSARQAIGSDQVAGSVLLSTQVIPFQPRGHTV